MLIVSDAIRHLILKKADSTSICRQALEEGMKTLRHDGAQEVIAGVTTLEEVARVTQE
jgi:general secretion pathway protein E